jgi:hypothetical protein
MKTKRHVTNNLAGYLEGMLPPETRARVEGHLASCAHCRAELADMRAMGLALTEAGRAAPVPATDGARWSRIHAEIAPTPARRRFAPPWAFAGGAALAAVVVAGVLNMRPDTVSPIRDEQPRMVARAPETARPAAPSPAIGATREPAEPSAPRRPIIELIPPAPPAPTHRPVGPGAAEPPPATSVRPPAEHSPATEPAPVPVPAIAPAPATAAVRREVAGAMAAPEAKALAPDAIGAALPYHDDTTLRLAAPPDAPATLGDAGGSPFGGGTSAADAQARQAFAPAQSGAVVSQRKTATASESKQEALGEFARAESDRAMGKADKAKKGYSAALDTGLPPTQARIAHIRLGDAAVKRKDDATALKEYTAAVEIAKDGSLLTRLGGVYDRLGSADKAESAYRAALTLSPENAEARAGLERSVKRTR